MRIRTRSVVAFVVMTGLSMNVQALVEPNWPAGTNNSCRSSTHGFIDFETGADGQVVRSSIPGTQFTTTDGFDWQYADWRTGRYNGPYPSGSYTSNGNFFAWLGPQQGQGRIDFLLGTATYVSVLTSTASGLVMDAFDLSGALIATSGRAGPNIGTGTLTRLSVDAPSGSGISFVVIHDSGNLWLIDDLCTDAAGVPPVYSAVADAARSVIGATYTLGAKGYDGGTAGTRSFVEPSRILSTGYNYYSAANGGYVPGHGLDCSGLTMWSFNRTFHGGATINWSNCLQRRECPVFQEGADGQFRANTDRITASEVRVGDLLFFDYCVGSAANCTPGQDGAMDHVAMYVDPFVSGGRTYNVVHASGRAGAAVPAVFDAATNSLSTTLAGGSVQTLSVANYGRVSDPRLDAWIVTHSPVRLRVTDPGQRQVTWENSLLNDIGHTREIPGMYYMVKEIDAGGADDTVAIPELMQGVYLIDIDPKPGASPSDVFSLEIRLPNRTITLADRVLIGDLLSSAFAFEVGDQGVAEAQRAAVDIKPGDLTACINQKSRGSTPVALLGSATFDVTMIDGQSLQIDDDMDRTSTGLSPTKWSSNADVNRDGFVDLVMHFQTQGLDTAGLLRDDLPIFVTGQMFDGSVFIGTDVIYLVGSSACGSFK